MKAEGSAMNTIDMQLDGLEALLPWHAAGTLNRRDAGQVARALGSDRELARRFNRVREELHETIHLNETLGAPPAQAMDRLFAAIDAEPARAADVSFDLAGRLARFIANLSPRTLAWSASAAAFAVVLQAGIIATGLITQETGQGTELASAGATDGLAVIRFDPKADAAEITRFLVAYDASMIDGPKTGGIFTIRLPVTGHAKDDLIMRMRAQSSTVQFIANFQ
jgi:hypothetical protein